MPLQIGQTLLNKYRIERLIGEGGFGYVYQAIDVLLNRRVAIKELKPEVGCNPDALKRFLREAQIASAINHPNIVAVHGLELGQEGYYIIMEFMDSGSLADTLLRRQDLTPSEAVKIALPILAALAAIHQRGIVHRDIKPSNILFSSNGQIKLGDFGIARRLAQSEQSATQAGAVLGTVHYMSPEQVRGEKADARSDLYALGCVLYEMLTGRRYLDFGDEVLWNLELVKTRAPSPLPVTTPIGVAAAVMKSLAKKREARFQNAMEMSRALEKTIVEPMTVERHARTPTQPIVIRRQPAGIPFPAVMVGILAILALMLIGLAVASLGLHLPIFTASAQKTVASATSASALVIAPSLSAVAATPSLNTSIPVAQGGEPAPATPLATSRPTLAPSPAVSVTPTPVGTPLQGEIWFNTTGSTVSTLSNIFFFTRGLDQS